jgi:hypothetical protein
VLYRQTNELVLIKYLAGYLQFVPIIASKYWIIGEMYELKSVEVGIEKISERLNENFFPLAFRTLVRSHPVVTASFKIRQMAAHKYFYHWLGPVNAITEYYNRRIGTALVTRAIRKAKDCGVMTP